MTGWLDPIADGATICAGAGSVYLYDGNRQIELSSPAEIEIWT